MNTRTVLTVFLALFLISCGDSPVKPDPPKPDPPDPPEPNPTVTVAITAPEMDEEFELGSQIPCEVDVELSPDSASITVSFELNGDSIACPSGKLGDDPGVGEYELVASATGDATDSDSVQFSVVPVGEPPNISITRPDREGWPFVDGNVILAEAEHHDPDGDSVSVTWHLNDREVGKGSEAELTAQTGDSLLIARAVDSNDRVSDDTLRIHTSEKQIVFGGSRGDWDFYIADVGPDVPDYPETFNLTRDGTQKIEPAFSLDGSKMAWIGIGECGQSGMLFVSDYDYRNKREVSREGGECAYEPAARTPVFSPSGDRVAFKAGYDHPNFTNGVAALYIARTSGDGIERVPTLTCETPEDPGPCLRTTGRGVFTPDGESVIASSYEQHHTNHKQVVLEWDLDTGDSTRIFERRNVPPTFVTDVSRDGEWIALRLWHDVPADGETPSMQVVIVRRDGSEVREITPVDDSGEAFFYDNETVCFKLYPNNSTLRCTDLNGSVKWETRYSRNITSPQLIR